MIMRSIKLPACLAQDKLYEPKCSYILKRSNNIFKFGSIIQKACNTKKQRKVCNYCFHPVVSAGQEDQATPPEIDQSNFQEIYDKAKEQFFDALSQGPTQEALQAIEEEGSKAQADMLRECLGWYYQPATKYVQIQALKSDLDRTVGTMTGMLCGDMLGQLFDGVSAVHYLQFEKEYIDYMISKERRTYSGVVEIAFNISQSLAVNQGLSKEHCAKAIYTGANVFRKYKPIILRTIQELQQENVDYTRSGRWVSDGSQDNGGSAGCIAPIGLCLRNAQPSAIRQAVQEALLSIYVNKCTIEAAYLQASAIAYLCTRSAAKTTPEDFLTHLQSLSEMEEVQTKIDYMLHGLQALKLEDFKAAMHDSRQGGNWEGDVNDFRCAFDEEVVKAISSVKASRGLDVLLLVLWVFCRHWHDPMGAIIGANKKDDQITRKNFKNSFRK
eukprot:TRINITY_DN3602_c0_g2_i3.p1 TRINITY_DN3602_c0_g2~~TRINITY_DN3602_c0_g2_i3.p1  ORF type:complete len:441 (-),score=27.01 TRINITY_DN3602_c0_g2_i3:21-1343(-)